MANRFDKKTVLIERLADHVLAHGIGAASLRPLAAAAGTSDRMLLYYFPDKEALIAALLERVALRMLLALEAELPDRTPLARDELMQRLWPVATSPTFRPYMVVWLEVAALAARNAEPYRQIAGQIAEGFLEWAKGRLALQPGEDPTQKAAELLTRIDGAMLMHALGRGDIADASFG